jgi:hypothetical protein
MTGAWVSWSADVLTWPGVDDITTNLDRAVEAMSWQDDVYESRYDYTPGDRTVTFHILVRWGITEVVAKRQAIDALRASLPPAGLGMNGRHVGPHIVATLRFSWWPDAFRWR